MEISYLEPGGVSFGKRVDSVQDVGIALAHEDVGGATTVWGEYNTAFVVAHRENFIFIEGVSG